MVENKCFSFTGVLCHPEISGVISPLRLTVFWGASTLILHESLKVQFVDANTVGPAPSSHQSSLMFKTSLYPRVPIL